MNDNIALSKEIGKYRIDIIQDIYPVNPREDYDHLGTLVVFSNKYNLSDKSNIHDINHLKLYLHQNKCVSLPIYLGCYQEVQLCIDGDPVYHKGYIFVEKEKIIQEYGKLDAVIEEKVLQNLRCEIKEFNHYLSGECYGYSITIQDEEFEEEYDSSFGYYGTPEEILAFVIDDHESIFKGESK